jgi:hypothetical protein
MLKHQGSNVGFVYIIIEYLSSMETVHSNIAINCDTLNKKDVFIILYNSEAFVHKLLRGGFHLGQRKSGGI